MTEPAPTTPPDLSALLAAWRQAIAATDQLSDEHDAMLTNAHASFDAPAAYRQPLTALTRRIEAASQRENEAGRTYLAAHIAAEHPVEEGGT